MQQGVVFNGLRVRARLAVALALVAVAALPAPASAAGPRVVFNDSMSTVTYRMSTPPNPDRTDSDNDAGQKTLAQLAEQATSPQGVATALTKQTTTTRHGPTDDGYAVRRINAVGNLSGTAQLTDQAGGPVATEATADSVTSFRVNEKVGFAVTTVRTVQTDNVDVDCSLATATLKRSGVVVLRRVSATKGCTSVPSTVGDSGGELTPGFYTFETHAEGETSAPNEFETPYTFDMLAKVNATLELGTGKVCRNVLPTAGATIVGTAGNDVLCGGPGADTLKGYGGNDLLLGEGRGDILLGGAGSDVLKPGTGHDEAKGNAGADTVRGCDDLKDVLRGGTGNDSVYRDAVDVIGGFETKTRC